MSKLPENLVAQMATERKFIHDLASPLMIAMGMVESVHSKTEDETHKQRLEKAKNALDKMSDILKNRRSLLIELMDELENS